MKVIVAIAAVGVLFLGFWVAVYQSKQTLIVSLNAKIQQARVDYQAAQVQAQNLEQWKQSEAAFETVLQQLHQTGSTKDFVPSFLRDIERLVSEERISTDDPSFRVSSITPKGAGNTGGQLSQASQAGQTASPPPIQAVSRGVNLQFYGRFDTIVDFLWQLGNFKLHKVATIEGITLSPQSTTGGGSPTLSVTMPFQVYLMGGG